MHSRWDKAVNGTVVKLDWELLLQSLFDDNFQKLVHCNFWAENFKTVDVEINVWSSLFANLKTNLVLRLISRD